MVICLRSRQKKIFRWMFDSPFRKIVFFSKLRSLFWKKNYLELFGRYRGRSLGGFWVGFWGFLGFQSPIPPKYPFNPKKRPPASSWGPVSPQGRHDQVNLHPSRKGSQGFLLEGWDDFLKFASRIPWMVLCAYVKNGILGNCRWRDWMVSDVDGS